jgi:hypothetical protein
MPIAAAVSQDKGPGHVAAPDGLSAGHSALWALWPNYLT